MHACVCRHVCSGMCVGMCVDVRMRRIDAVLLHAATHMLMYLFFGILLLGRCDEETEGMGLLVINLWQVNAQNTTLDACR